MLKKILVPIDGTEYSWRALDYATALVSLSGGELVIMTVSRNNFQPVYHIDGDCLVPQIGNEVLDAARAVMHGKNIDCIYLMENSSKVTESILEAAEKEHCDGIVLGSRGLGVVEGLLRSSVSQVIAEEATVPVTIVK